MAASAGLASSRRKARPTRALRASEFFAGIGLVRLALEEHNWQVVFANDIDSEKLEMYEANFGREHFHLGDIHKLNAGDIPSSDLFTASFPCNDLSIAGAWEGLSGKESSAFWGLIDILKDLGDRRPSIVLLENVVGFLQSRQGKDLELALVALNELGYAVDAIILNAVHWVPQSRARLFIVATIGLRDRTTAMAIETDCRPDPLCVFINTHQNIRWALRDLPKLPRPSTTLKDIVEDLPDDDPHWWSKERCEYFFNQLSARHLMAARLMMGQKTTRYATAFRRVRNGRSMAELRTDGIAGCLRTPRGGSGRQILFKAGRGKYQVRLLTARECARLQGVPDSYVINVPLNQALFGFGDAVCVPTVRWIAKNYLTPVAAEIALGPPLFVTMATKQLEGASS
ncbi:MAG TPA: DNA (cytosine-5-)-methyltransferase [Tepidisphaeraceae bacterium]|nr:DNA (cytosine-5-)-methyltransferase [Tepidisphaeraceae bacterium]